MSRCPCSLHCHHIVTFLRDVTQDIEEPSICLQSHVTHLQCRQSKRSKCFFPNLRYSLYLCCFRVCEGNICEVLKQVLPEPAGGFAIILCRSVFLLGPLSFGMSGQEMIAGLCSFTFFSDWLCLSCLRLFSLLGCRRRQTHSHLPVE